MKVILLERVGRPRPPRRRSHRQGRLRPQLPPAARQGAARHRGQPQASSNATAPTSRSATQERRKAAAGIAAGLNGKPRGHHPPGRRNRPALRFGLRPRRRRGAVNADGGTVDRSQVDLDKPIKTLGLHAVQAAPARRSRGHRHRQHRPLAGRSRAPGEGRRPHRHQLRRGSRGSLPHRPGRSCRRGGSGRRRRVICRLHQEFKGRERSRPFCACPRVAGRVSVRRPIRNPSLSLPPGSTLPTGACPALLHALSHRHNYARHGGPRW